LFRLLTTWHPTLFSNFQRTSQLRPQQPGHTFYISEPTKYFNPLWRRLILFRITKFEFNHSGAPPGSARAANSHMHTICVCVGTFHCWSAEKWVSLSHCFSAILMTIKVAPLSCHTACIFPGTKRTDRENYINMSSSGVASARFCDVRAKTTHASGDYLSQVTPSEREREIADINAINSIALWRT
jgi:hypothetical protein